MKFFRIMLCFLLMFASFSVLGCRVDGRSASKILGLVKKEAKQEVAQQAVEYAVREATGSKSPKPSTKAGTPNVPTAKPGGTSKATLATAGVTALAGAAVANEASASNSNVNQAKDVLVGYYHAIADKRMRDAYSSLTWDVQNQLGTFETYSQSYNTTLSNDVTNIEVLSESDSSIKLSYQLTSKDKVNGKLLTQVFVGKADLIKSDGRWLINGFDVKVK